MLPDGRLQAVLLRECFPDEAQDFTPWLAQADNLAELSATLDMELELDGTEVPVGPYFADIVATDGEDRVVIENQLTRTNHDHLGKVLTYAAGLQAKTVIWIAETFTEEHRRTADFLNEVTTDALRVFGIEMRLYRIGGSPPAPQFHVIARPNDYLRSVTTQAAASKDLTETRRLYLRFWQGWYEYASARSKIVRPRKARAQHWTNVALGRSKFSVSLHASLQKSQLTCGVYIRGTLAHVAFELLREHKDQIERATGELTWRAPADKQDRRILQRKDGVDLANEGKWSESYAWFLERSEVLHRAFSQRVKALDISDELTDSDEGAETD